MIMVSGACWAEGPFGAWKMNPARSTFASDPPSKSLTMRIEPHTRGEVFNLDRIEADGRATTSSTILYFDGKPRDFQDFGCSETQSSRRTGSQTVEILHKCTGGACIRFIRRLAEPSKQLILEITEQHPDGRRIERLVFERERRDQ